MSEHEQFDIFDDSDRQVARIVLNGYNIAPGGPLGAHGAMRSFMIVSGELRTHWHEQTVLSLRSEDGRQADIRIAALPVDKGNAGLVEFV